MLIMYSSLTLPSTKILAQGSEPILQGQSSIRRIVILSQKQTMLNEYNYDNKGNIIAFLKKTKKWIVIMNL